MLNPVAQIKYMYMYVGVNAVSFQNIRSFISYISIGLFSPLLFRSAPDYSIDIVSELTHWSATGNCEWRTCPKFLHGGWSGIRTCDPLDARHRAYHSATMPHCKSRNSSWKILAFLLGSGCRSRTSSLSMHDGWVVCLWRRCMGMDIVK